MQHELPAKELGELARRRLVISTGESNDDSIYERRVFRHLGLTSWLSTRVVPSTALRELTTT